MSVHEIRHPLIRHKLGLLRRAEISAKSFRELTAEVASLLTYEATRDLPLEQSRIETWSGALTVVDRIKGKKVTVVPVLRAGIGMLDGVLRLIPSARISVVGLYRDETTLQPIVYFEKLASHLEQRLALVIDPMLATGGTLCATIAMLKKAGCRQIRVLSLVAAPEGLHAVEAAHPDVDLYVAARDDCLNEASYILPGLGDAGDKLFGTK